MIKTKPMSRMNGFRWTYNNFNVNSVACAKHGTAHILHLYKDVKTWEIYAIKLGMLNR